MNKNILKIRTGKTSKNYKKLYKKMQKKRIICIVDYGANNIRDIAMTQPVFKKNYLTVSSRGVEYVSAFSKKEFINQCKEMNLEYLK